MASQKITDTSEPNRGRINKRDDIYWTIILETRRKIANPTLSDYVSSVASDKVDDIVSDIDMNESDDVMDINPLTVELEALIVEDD